MTKSIVVVGGGFAGFWAALAARRVGGDRLAVTLLSREPVLQMRPRLYEADPQSLAVALEPLLHKAGVGFRQVEASGVDPAARTLELATGERIAYDRLVVATGSRISRPQIPGADLAFTIDTQAEAIAFDRRLAELARRAAPPRVAIVGAGFTGIELALEMRDRIALHGGPDQAEKARIVLLDRADVVGAALGAGPRPTIVAALEAANVELRLGVSVVSVAESGVTLDDGAAVGADVVVLTTGMVAAPFTARIPGERDRLGRIEVDRFLRAPAAPEILVTGDAASADTGDGHRAMQSCQHALQLGRFAGENAARDLLGMPLVPYAQPRYVTCLDLGRAGAVLTQGWDRGLVQAGAGAKTLKQRINRHVIYPPLDGPGAELLALSSVDPIEQMRPGG